MIKISANRNIKPKYMGHICNCPFCHTPPLVELEFHGAFYKKPRPRIRCANHVCKVKPFLMGYNDETIEDLEKIWNRCEEK